MDRLIDESSMRGRAGRCKVAAVVPGCSGGGDAEPQEGSDYHGGWGADHAYAHLVQQDAVPPGASRRIEGWLH